jgi:hypothetical protein
MPSRFTTGTIAPITWPLHEAVLLELIGLQRRVGCAERDGLGLDLLDARTRADRLIVQTIAGVFLVGVSPLRIDREWECRAGTGDIRSLRAERRRGQKAGGEGKFKEIHWLSPSFKRARRRLRQKTRWLGAKLPTLRCSVSLSVPAFTRR